MQYILPSIAVIAALTALLWILSIQRKLIILGRSADDSLSQIGVHLSAGWDAVIVILNLIKGYASNEYPSLSGIADARSAVTPSSTPNEIKQQENMLAQAMYKLTTAADKYPALKANENYMSSIDSIADVRQKLSLSCFTYDERAARLNRYLEFAPAALVAKLFGVKERPHLDSDHASKKRSREDENTLPPSDTQ